MKKFLIDGLLLLAAPVLFPLWWGVKLWLFGRSGVPWIDAVLGRKPRPPLPARVVLYWRRRK